ncbi:MAG TPA: hypothetical protein VIK89_02235, partial [Cytophagaceae bacterium]
SLDTPALEMPGITQCLGVYPREADNEIPDDGSCGVLIVETSPFFLKGTAYAFTANGDLQETISEGENYNNKEPVESVEKVKQEMETYAEEVNEATEDQILDYYAKLKFLQTKYLDRTGSFTTVFNPYWVPGTTGSLYTREPGLYVNFFVHTVTHDIGLAPPSIGRAVTQVSFNSARMSKDAQGVPGVTKEELFNYTVEDMVNLQKSWTNNITGGS